MVSHSVVSEGKVSRFVVGTGFATLDRIYTPMRERPVEALGGSCANVLISLAMLGHRVAPILTLGSDATGTFLVDEMRRAGCVTRFVFREPNQESPVTVEHLNVQLARHSFSSTCPETHRRFSSYKPLEESNADRAKHAIRAAAIFYVDRLSSTTLETMGEASRAGALVLFEPNSVKDWALFRRALSLIDILKVSEEVRFQLDTQEFDAPPYFITTRGNRGLTLETSTQRIALPPMIAPRLVDTCGAGDMVTIGLIHALMHADATHRSILINDVYSGLIMGQWLAAVNCAFIGARGLFHAFDGQTILDALDMSSGSALDISSIEPYAGY